MTRLYLVPPIVIRLAKDDMTKNYNLSNLEQIVCGAAPLGSDTMRLLRAKFKDIVFRQGGYSFISSNSAYGMTETSTVITAQRHDDQVDGSSGLLVPNMLAKIMDPITGKEITEYGKPGELWVSGPNVTLGYLRRPKETKEMWTYDNEGKQWLHTGDEVEVRLSKKCQEHFWIVDRIKELIKVRCPSDLTDF
jgi:acyl-CoA synthetase (AMP-forming)/AMP-acid ligase II